jgi:hypothetical protein
VEQPHERLAVSLLDGRGGSHVDGSNLFFHEPSLRPRP